MAAYNVGEFIKEKRERMGLTQEELCEGICSVSTLSRIERGNQEPRKGTIQMLLQRLGCSESALVLSYDGDSFEVLNLIYRLRQAYILHRYDEAKELFSELDKSHDKLSPSDRQFYETVGAILNQEKLSDSEILDRLESAMRITHPKYDKDHLPRLLSFEEITVLNNIAIYYSHLGDRSKAIEILYHISNFYSKSFISEAEALRTQPMIYYNLSKYLGLAGRYDECIEICNKGIRLAEETGRAMLLPRTLYNLSWALVKRGRSCDIEPAKQALKEAYYSAKLLDNRQSFINRMEKFAEENFMVELAENY